VVEDLLRRRRALAGDLRLRTCRPCRFFIDDLAVGGSDELSALDRAGKLDMMLGL